MMIKKYISIIFVLSYISFFSTLVLAQEGYTPNTSVINLVNEGIEFHKKKDYENAIKSFEEALLIEPSNTLVKQNISIAHNNYGKYLAERTDYKKALNEFRWALFYDSKNSTADGNLDAVLAKQGVKVDDPLARLQLGDKLREEAEFELALIEYRKAESLSTIPNPVVLISIGDIYYILYLREGQKTDDIHRAIDSYKKALEIKETAKAHVKVGDGLLALRDIVGAIEHYKKAADLEPESPDVLAANVRGWNEAVRLAPLVAENHVGLAQALQLKADFLHAEEEYNQALKLDPGNEAAIRGLESLAKDKKIKQASEHLKLALKLQLEKNYDGAIEEYVKALDITPQDPNIHYNIGTAFQAIGDHEHAEKAYRKSLELSENNERAKDALNNLYKEIEAKKIGDLLTQALELQNSGNYQGAITAYQAAISLKSDDPQLYFNLGTAYQANGNLQEALKQYEKAFELNNQNKDYSDAISLVKETIAKPLADSAVQKQTSGDVLGAINDYKSALEITPRNAQLHFNLATAYQVNSQVDDAINSYTEAVKLDTKSQVDAYFFLATIYEEKKVNQLAIQNYEKYLNNAPTGTYAKDAKERAAYLRTLKP